MVKYLNGGGNARSHTPSDVPEGQGFKSLPSSTPINTVSTEGEGLISRPSRPCVSHPNYSHYRYPKQKKEPLDDSYYVHYTEELSNFNELLLNHTVHCTPKYLVIGCQNPEHPRHIVPSTCMKKNCISCKSFTSMKRARKVMSKFSSGKHNFKGQDVFPTIIYTVFTVPEEIRDSFIDSKFVAKIRRKIWAMLKKYFNAEYAIEAVHPISEEHPDKFHPHFNFLWMRKNNLSGYIDDKLLREKYASILNYAKQVNVYTQYSNKPAKLWKWSQYVTRVFPEFSNWIGNIRWYGKVPETERSKVDLCPECQLPLIALGYLTPESAAQYLESDVAHDRAPPGLLVDYNINFFLDF